VAAHARGGNSRVAELHKGTVRARHASKPLTPLTTYRPRRECRRYPDDFTVQTQAAQAITKGLYTPAAGLRAGQQTGVRRGGGHHRFMSNNPGTCPAAP